MVFSGRAFFFRVKLVVPLISVWSRLPALAIFLQLVMQRL